MTASRLALAFALTASLAACATDDLDHLGSRASTEAQTLFAALRGEPVAPDTRDLASASLSAASPVRPLDQAFEASDPRSGAALRFDPQSFGERGIEVTQSNGCVWRRDDWFAPSEYWRNCGDSRDWQNGEALVSGGDGLWPLRIGAQARWTRTARSSTGRSFERVTVCSVDDAVEVLRDDHPPTPAFVVACNDGKRERTTWWAPDEGPVAFRVVHGEKGIEELWVRD